MAIHLPRPRHDLTLLSASELARRLNIPESQMHKAIRDGVIRPLGIVGRVALVALSEEDLDELRQRYNPATAHPNIA